MTVAAEPDDRSPEAWLDRWAGQCVEAHAALVTIAERCDGTPPRRASGEVISVLSEVMKKGYAELVGHAPEGSVWRPTVLCLSFVATPSGDQDLSFAGAARTAARNRGRDWCMAHGGRELSIGNWSWWALPQTFRPCLDGFYDAVDAAERVDPEVVMAEDAVRNCPPWGRAVRVVEAHERRREARARAREHLGPLFRNSRLLGL